MTCVAVLQFFERVFAEKNHDLIGKKLLLDMDEREHIEWEPWSDDEWDIARIVDEGEQGYWEARYGKKLGSPKSRRVYSA